ncbi:MAG: hypothetical protein NTX33_00100 [Propionibacteriales bacterium]|nr:hypothetical protein [Propionibacteriales bacterium]
MVSVPNPSNSPSADDNHQALEDLWLERLARRSSRRQAKQRARRAGRRIVVEADTRPQPDTERMSRALLALRRQLDAAAAERAARTGDDAGGVEGRS